MPHSEREIINICVVGQVGVGKSSLTLQYTQQTFPAEHDTSVEDIYTRNFQYNGKSYSLNFLDTATEEDYSQFKDAQFKQADGFIIVYSVASAKSFNTASTSFSHIQRVHSEIPPTILLGNQTDLILERQVGEEDAELLVQQLGMAKHFEVSAKSNINVTEAFEYIAKLVIDSKSGEDLRAVDIQQISNGQSSVSAFSDAPVSERPRRESRHSDIQRQKTFTISNILENNQEKVHDTIEVTEDPADFTADSKVARSRSVQSRKINSEEISDKSTGCGCLIM